VGFSLKLIDQVNDEDYKLNSKVKYIILFSSAIIAGIGMILDLYNAAIGLTLILGLLISKKVNVLDFQIYAVVVPLTMVAFSFFNQFYIFLNLHLIILTIIILLVGIILDELLNNYLDSLSINNKLFKSLTSIRPILKIVAFLLPLFNIFTFYHSFQILLFDIGYDLTKVITEKQMKNKRESS